MRPPVLPVNDNAVVAERVRLRVLVVDDNAMVADEVAAMLSAAELEVVGPATTPEDALNFALRAALDAAVLDVRLCDDTVFPVAKVLQVRRVPFMFLTGVWSAVLPVEFETVPLLAKPFRRQALQQGVWQLLAGPRA